MIKEEIGLAVVYLLAKKEVIEIVKNILLLNHLLE